MTRPTPPTPAARVTKLVIPGDPPSLNNQMRGKRRDIIREKSQWQRWTENAWLDAGRPTFQHPVVLVVCYFATKRKRDRENYTMKSLVDALTRCGAWHDDNADEFTQLPTQLAIDPENPRVVIIVSEGTQPMTTPPPTASDADVAALRELYAKATPVPWRWASDATLESQAHMTTDYGEFGSVLAEYPTEIMVEGRHFFAKDADAELVVAAVNAVPALLAALERAEAVCALPFTAIGRPHDGGAGR